MLSFCMTLKQPMHINDGTNQHTHTHGLWKEKRTWRTQGYSSICGFCFWQLQNYMKRNLKKK
jgi:hypothetical protein